MQILLKNLLVVARPVQWVKNIIIFIPLISSQRYEIENILLGLKAFVIFSLISSSGYIINDIFDSNNDKLHPIKKLRPIASGELNNKKSICYSIILLSLSIIIGMNEGFNFILIIVLYLTISFSYSFFLKKIIILDLAIISILFLIRIIGGSEIIDVVTSKYLLFFSLLFFLSLAGIKRLAEIQISYKNKILELPGRSYAYKNKRFLEFTIISSFVFSIFTLIMYISSESASLIYSNIYTLYVVCFLLMIWFYRMYNKANTFKIQGEPILFALKDKVSIFILILSIIFVLISI